MGEARRAADQLRRSLTGPAWHGPALSAILGDVSAEEAAQRPVPTAHSIAELVEHITAWVRAADRGLDNHLVQLEPTSDWPPPGDWAFARGALETAIEQLAARIEAMPDEALKTNVHGAEGDYSRYFLIHGVTQHNLYHAGQLALLKKAARHTT
jgi:uncharacterized damage-inducible protein DinB